ncbi:PqqD family protein [Streptantibioticus cattleyicolor]|uniref:Coenzyme PQQ synthesis protein D (PqqD) n=1 Tax=Streptantibioticus cattleyicolor (strain ATCC 35852 / DSM 46488 / JCM 4925 / NBRC 14057 / NRRL 8057) TaxID=1003195 RepID=F8JKW6_STREN|nr:PqqD family protein [Streptantibioticus cattleyicolor]AEW99679.1 hypothetical protein SCATT_p14860 [Streptantibioticus cattleyicolor NRRL 8057 = DSM 46488]CCB71283.1 conserved protein of unknown function [Streptantibioticus cattleyicolor NRRL 8057 = DSM 46488]
MRYGISDNVIWTPGVDEVRLYDCDTQEFQTMNSTAAEIWTLVADGREVDDVVATMVDRHTDGSPEQARLVGSDVRDFVLDLARRGLLTDHTPTPPARPAATPPEKTLT